jgi:hypothetical protein
MFYMPNQSYIVLYKSPKIVALKAKYILFILCILTMFFFFVVAPCWGVAQGACWANPSISPKNQ